ncbi:MAG: SpoIVB peptidase [Clostridia bacterium]|nr:SpoIVB peptidase [Clostridia bacterium]
MQKYKNKLKGITLFLALVLCLSLVALADGEVYIGGFPFGVKMTTNGVFVSATGDIDSAVGRVCPARDAGVLEGDIIISINGKRVDSAQQVADLISDSKGKRLELEIKREGKALTVNLIPVQTSDGKSYKTGLFIKDSASGIGTVTYVEEDGQTFGGLGHGITDRATLKLLPLGEGTVHNVEINDVVKGSAEHPGELKGTLNSNEVGTLLKNTDMGVFGRLDKKIKALEKVEVASPGEIKEGKCTIYTCLAGQSSTPLEAQIVKIVDRNSDTKNFIVTLTDKKGLERAGGIVQGMSGSPIVQNGKLVGAVTHVLMRDQTSGYGIFIENMLEAE